MRVITWITILIQLFIPLFLPFTSVTAATRLLPENSTITHVDTEPYRLDTNETVESVAKKYAISVDELKRINIYRTFSKPFMTLTVGDEIDVPRKKNPFTVDNNVTVPVEENRLASNAAMGASLLSRSDTAKSVENMARSVVNNEISSSAQQWLGQFGTARVQFNTNDDFEFDSSAIDLLLPLHDSQKNMLFVQLGGRNKDSRNTINIGAGVRAFLNNWMYGANTFFDNDITGNNRRGGIGAEAWTDYLKLSINGYFGTTDWHQSRDFADYNERPANGYDLRAEAYLPVYPQLGGKLMYEQYNGDEVALFGKDKRQKDPHAITAGINYTPVSLVTVGIDHRAGKSSKSDSSINIQFNYHLGNSWQSHIDPSAVAATRTLAGSRYDLVERNNNIVLDYQKQELIRLALIPTQVTAEASSTTVINAQVTTKYTFERIEWDSAALVAAGGTLTQVSPQSVAIKLPPYQLTRSSSNIHLLSAVAYDNQGNASNRDTMQVTVIPSAATITSKNLTVTTDGAFADGSATNAVQAIVTDVNNKPVSEQVVTFSADNSANVTTVIGTTGMDGVATATLTNTTAGVSKVTASVNGNSQHVNVTFVADGSNLSITNSTLVASPTSIVADGTSASTLTLTLKDVNNNLVSGQIVTFGSSLTNSTVGTVSDNGDGTYSAPLIGTTAGTANITVSVGGNALGVASTTVTLNGNSSDLSTTNSMLVAAPVAIEANNSDTSVVTLTLRDSNNNPVTGQTVAFTTALGTLGAVSEGSSGVYTATLKAGIVAGVASVTASVGGSAFGVAPATVTLRTPVTFTGISVNGHTFGKDEGFPTTGFENASFTLNMNGNPTDFVWTTNSANVGVNGNGVVTFNTEFSGPVTITATSNVDANVLTYTFTVTVENWFYPQQVGINWADALALCNVPGRQLPPLVGKMAQGENVRGIGSLWGEWGNMDTYGQLTSSPNGIAWTNQESTVSPGQYFTAYFTGSNGGLTIEHETWNNDSNYVAICQRKP